jgi:hypothetical protein
METLNQNQGTREKKKAATPHLLNRNPKPDEDKKSSPLCSVQL